MDNRESPSFATQTLVRELFKNQHEMAKKLDALQDYIVEHMAEEDKTFSSLNVSIARIDEKLKSHTRQWSFVATVITAIISTSIFQFLRNAIR